MALDIKTNVNLNINKSEILSISNKKSRIDAKLLRKIKIFFSCKWCNRKFDIELAKLKDRKKINEKKLEDLKQKMDKFNVSAKTINEKIRGSSDFIKNDSELNSILGKRDFLRQKVNKIIKDLKKSNELQASILSGSSFTYYTSYDFDWKKIKFKKENFTNVKTYICKKHKILKIENTIDRLLIKSNNINKLLEIFKPK